MTTDLVSTELFAYSGALGEENVLPGETQTCLKAGSEFIEHMKSRIG